MKSLRIFYSLRKNGKINFGDNITPILIEKVTGIEVKFTNIVSCDYAAIGSIIEMIQKRRYKRLYRLKLTPIKIWGAGCIRPGSAISNFLIEPLALRGELTRERLNAGNIPLGDPGILFNRLHTPQQIKQHKYGIVAHYTDSGSPVIAQLLESNKHTVLIPVDIEPLETLKMIASCECIISSSLHGLVAADSFGIPNYKCSFFGKLDGGDYKFMDYCTGIDRPFCHDLKLETLDLDQIVGVNSCDFSYQKNVEEKAVKLEHALVNSF